MFVVIFLSKYAHSSVIYIEISSPNANVEHEIVINRMCQYSFYKYTYTNPVFFVPGYL